MIIILETFSRQALSDKDLTTQDAFSDSFTAESCKKEKKNKWNKKLSILSRTPEARCFACGAKSIIIVYANLITIAGV